MKCHTKAKLCWAARLTLLIVLTWPLTACSSVKPWERGTHALTPMQAKDLKCQRFERNIEAYREGSVGAAGGKSGGGCGCS